LPTERVSFLIQHRGNIIVAAFYRGTLDVQLANQLTDLVATLYPPELHEYYFPDDWMLVYARPPQPHD